MFCWGREICNGAVVVKAVSQNARQALILTKQSFHLNCFHFPKIDHGPRRNLPSRVRKWTAGIGVFLKRKWIHLLTGTFQYSGRAAASWHCLCLDIYLLPLCHPQELCLQDPSHFSCPLLFFSYPSKSLILFLNHCFFFQGHGKVWLWKCCRFVSFPVIRLGQLVNINTPVCGGCDLSFSAVLWEKNQQQKNGKKPVNCHLHVNRDNMLLFPQCTNINCSQILVQL